MTRCDCCIDPPVRPRVLCVCDYDYGYQSGVESDVSCPSEDEPIPAVSRYRFMIEGQWLVLYFCGNCTWSGSVGDWVAVLDGEQKEITLMHPTKGTATFNDADWDPLCKSEFMDSANAVGIKWLCVEPIASGCSGECVRFGAISCNGHASTTVYRVIYKGLSFLMVHDTGCNWTSSTITACGADWTATFDADALELTFTDGTTTLIYLADTFSDRLCGGTFALSGTDPQCCFGALLCIEAVSDVIDCQGLEFPNGVTVTDVTGLSVVPDALPSAPPCTVVSPASPGTIIYTNFKKSYLFSEFQAIWGQSVTATAYEVCAANEAIRTPGTPVETTCHGANPAPCISKELQVTVHSGGLVRFLVYLSCAQGGCESPSVDVGIQIRGEKVLTQADIDSGTLTIPVDPPSAITLSSKTFEGSITYPTQLVFQV